MNEIRLDGLIIVNPFLSVKPERRKMKLDLKLPGGGELHFEKEPMSEGSRLLLLVAMIIAGVLAFFLGMAWILR